VDDPSREGRRHVLTDTATTAPVGVPARRRLGLRTWHPFSVKTQLGVRF